MDAEEVGGWRASGWRESQPLDGGRYRHRIALSGKRTGRRGGVGKEGNNVACTYLFWLLAGPNERARGRGEARGRRG